MKVNALIVTGLLSILFSFKSYAQTDLIDITSKSNVGYCDLVLNIVQKEIVCESKTDYWLLTIKGQYKGTIVGFKIKFKNGLQPGLVDEVIDNTSWAKEAAEISGLGEESDNFVRIVSRLYGIKTDKPFTSRPIVFTCFSLNSEWAFLEEGYFKFKLYFDDSNKSGIYTEVFFNINFSDDYVEILDRNPQFRDGFIKMMIR